MTIWKSIAAAALGGAATAASDALTTEGAVNPKVLGIKAGVGAILAVALYLKQSPIKPKPEPQQSDPPPDPGPQG